VNQQPASGVKVTLRNDKDKSEQTITTGPDGGYEFDVKPNAPYTLTAEKNQYATKKAQIAKSKPKAKVVTDSLGLYGVGDVFQLKNIYYDLNRFFIRPDAAKELDRVLAVLKEYPTMKIEMRSHTDARATDAYNMRLSENRARAAKDYLVSRGIDAERITAQGYGENEIVNGCVDGVQCTESEHQKNRRTEFKVISVQ
jgi:outer membrane protein OmpA-like peptidoglycan-associated protein